MLSQLKIQLHGVLIADLVQVEVPFIYFVVLALIPLYTQLLIKLVPTFGIKGVCVAVPLHGIIFQHHEQLVNEYVHEESVKDRVVGVPSQFTVKVFGVIFGSVITTGAGTTTGAGAGTTTGAGGGGQYTEQLVAPLVGFGGRQRESATIVPSYFLH